LLKQEFFFLLLVYFFIVGNNTKIGNYHIEKSIKKNKKPIDNKLFMGYKSITKSKVKIKY